MFVIIIIRLDFVAFEHGRSDCCGAAVSAGHTGADMKRATAKSSRCGCAGCGVVDKL